MKHLKLDRQFIQVPQLRDYDPDLKAFTLLNQYINERVGAYHRHETGKRPFSTDPVISRYRFTNVFREYDRVSRAIIQNLMNHANDDPDLIFANIVKWRLLNTEEAAMRWDTDFKQQLWMSEPNIDSRLFTDAFMTVGMRSCYHLRNPDEPSDVACVYRVVRETVLCTKLYTSKIQSLRDPQQIMKVLMTIPGIARFLGYQIFVDCTYVKAFTNNTTFKFPFSENAFTVAGPGCHRGLMLVFPNDPHTQDAIKDAELHLAWLREYYQELCERLDLPYDPEQLFRERPDYDQRINLMAWENVMCEFQKYERLTRGNGVRARKYNGGTLK